MTPTNLVAAAAFLVVLVLVPWLPETIPLHWNIRGEVDGIGSRWWMLLLGALPLGMAVLLRIVPRKETSQNSKAHEVLTVATTLFLTAVVGLTLTASFGVPVPMVTVVPTLIGVLFVVIGVTLPWPRDAFRWGRAFVVAQGAVFFGIAGLPFPSEAKWTVGLGMIFALVAAQVVYWFVVAKDIKK